MKHLMTSWLHFCIDGRIDSDNVNNNTHWYWKHLHERVSDKQTEHTDVYNRERERVEEERDRESGERARE